MIETLFEYDVKITPIEDLIIDFKNELRINKFGDKYWESKSYQYMVNVVDIAHMLNRSVPKSKIMRLLNNLYISLKERYENILIFLEELNERM